MFTSSVETLKKTIEKYVEQVPKPLNRQFQERLDKEKAIHQQMERKKIVTQLFPLGML